MAETALASISTVSTLADTFSMANPTETKDESGKFPRILLIPLMYQSKPIRPHINLCDV